MKKEERQEREKLETWCQASDHPFCQSWVLCSLINPRVARLGGVREDG